MSKYHIKLEISLAIFPPIAIIACILGKSNDIMEKVFLQSMKNDIALKIAYMQI
jgi:hypothetical protein